MYYVIWVVINIAVPDNGWPMNATSECDRYAHGGHEVVVDCMWYGLMVLCRGVPHQLFSGGSNGSLTFPQSAYGLGKISKLYSSSCLSSSCPSSSLESSSRALPPGLARAGWLALMYRPVYMMTKAPVGIRSQLRSPQPLLGVWNTSSLYGHPCHGGRLCCNIFY